MLQPPPPPPPQEFLKKYTSTLQTYKKGVEVAERFLGHDHGITVTLRNSYLAARKSLSKQVGRAKATVARQAMRASRSAPAGGQVPPAAGSAAAPAPAPPPARVTGKDEKHWNEIHAAYGHVDGVTPVRAPVKTHSLRRVPPGTAAPAGGAGSGAGSSAASASGRHLDMISPRVAEDAGDAGGASSAAEDGEAMRGGDVPEALDEEE